LDFWTSAVDRFGPGGPNPLVFNSATGIPEVPPTFLPDQLKSYEIGYNGESADRRFGINVDVYYIDWRNLQIITQTTNGFGAYTNASAATVRGAEPCARGSGPRTRREPGDAARRDGGRSRGFLGVRPKTDVRQRCSGRTPFN